MSTDMKLQKKKRIKKSKPALKQLEIDLKKLSLYLAI